jgi:transcriptional regulator with XRE-family HTH domain
MSTQKFVEMSFMDRLEFAVNAKLSGNWAELSRKSGLGASTLHQIKSGADPKASSLQRISQALDVSLDWLLSGEGEMLKTKPTAAASPTEDRRVGISDRRLGIMQELLDGLNQTQQQEILSVIEEKKRLNEMQRQLDQLISQKSA